MNDKIVKKIVKSNAVETWQKTRPLTAGVKMNGHTFILTLNFK